MPCAAPDDNNNADDGPPLVHSILGCWLPVTRHHHATANRPCPSVVSTPVTLVRYARVPLTQRRSVSVLWFSFSASSSLEQQFDAFYTRQYWYSSYCAVCSRVFFDYSLPSACAPRVCAVYTEGNRYGYPITCGPLDGLSPRFRDQKVRKPN